MNRLELTDEQLLLVERALDFYSRVGIGQFDVIKEWWHKINKEQNINL